MLMLLLVRRRVTVRLTLHCQFGLNIHEVRMQGVRESERERDKSDWLKWKLKRKN